MGNTNSQVGMGTFHPLTHLTIRKAHKKALEEISYFLNNNVLQNLEVHTLVDINKHRATLREIVGHDDLLPTTQKLQQKLEKHFGDKIKVSHGKKKIIFSSSMTVDEAIRAHNTSDRVTQENQIKEVTFLLRKSIFGCKNTVLPNNLTIKDIKKGECETTEILRSFYKHLIVGPDQRNSWSDTKTRRVESLSQDAIFAVTSGRTKPSKHLKLGIAVKSMTGSRKMIEVLNRYGYIPSYNTIEEIETELTFEASKDQTMTPAGIDKDPNLEIGINSVYWKDYYRLMYIFGYTWKKYNIWNPSFGDFAVPTDLLNC